MAFKLGIAVDACMAYMLMLMSMTLTLMQGHSGLEESGEISVELSTKQSNKHFRIKSVSHDLDFENIMS